MYTGIILTIFSCFIFQKCWIFLLIEASCTQEAKRPAIWLGPCRTRTQDCMGKCIKEQSVCATTPLKSLLLLNPVWSYFLGLCLKLPEAHTWCKFLFRCVHTEFCHSDSDCWMQIDLKCSTDSEVLSKCEELIWLEDSLLGLHTSTGLTFCYCLQAERFQDPGKFSGASAGDIPRMNLILV